MTAADPTDARDLTPPEVAREMHIKPATVLGLIRSGELEAYNIGRGAKRPRFRITRPALERFKAKRMVMPPSRPAPRRQRASKDVIAFF